jgi:preprotein translocase subunit SecF
MSTFRDDFKNTEKDAWWSLPRIVAAVFVIGIVIIVLSLALGWFNAAKDVVSPQNVKQQYALAYQDYESLQATAGNVCDAETNLQDAKKSGDLNTINQRTDEVTAYRQNYRRIAAQYKARYDDAFQAKHVGPKDLPKDPPSLIEMKTQVC